MEEKRESGIYMGESYVFWNNKGGTGKTSLAFQTVTMYAECHESEKILVVDLCPQANLSELLLGGLLGGGAINLISLFNEKRATIGGYFQDRLPSPFTFPADINVYDYLTKPNDFNKFIPSNIFLLAGDPIVELQTNSIATLANTQIPGTDTWIAIVDWLNDFIKKTGKEFDTIFIDCNPSFSIYTQIAIASGTRLLLPVMADDSSRRALQNVFSLIYGIKMPSEIYQQYSFSSKMKNAGRRLPQIHLIIKNRLTQYMVVASAYNSVLSSIDEEVKKIIGINPELFTFKNVEDGMREVRDFQTTGVVAFAEATPFTQVKPGKHKIFKKKPTVRADYLRNCIEAMDKVVDSLK